MIEALICQFGLAFLMRKMRFGCVIVDLFDDFPKLS
jgi:hypothetical protein